MPEGARKREIERNPQGAWSWHNPFPLTVHLTRVLGTQSMPGVSSKLPGQDFDPDQPCRIRLPVHSILRYVMGPTQSFFPRVVGTRVNGGAWGRYFRQDLTLLSPPP